MLLSFITNKRTLAFSAVLIICLVLFLYQTRQSLPYRDITEHVNYTSYVSSNQNTYFDEKHAKTNTTFTKIHKILWWNEVDWMQRQISYNNMNLCKYNNCMVIRDTQLAPESSAIIISVIRMSTLRFVPETMFTNRPLDQAWVFYTREPPPQMSKYGFEDLSNPPWINKFNWSWTYHHDSDIITPYGYLIEKTTVVQRNYSEIFRKKTKTAAWLVSHCGASSERDEYVKLLRTYINVDIYGRCGNSAPPDIVKKISNEYYFYLGFESAICKDYVTEKFFKYYKQDVINVVRGGYDYDRHFPIGSFINTNNFKSVKALANFMRQLKSDEKAYTKYIQAKDQFQVYRAPDTTPNFYQDAMCTICEKINNIGSNRNVYNNVHEWLDKCQEPTDLILK